MSRHPVLLQLRLEQSRHLHQLVLHQLQLDLSERLSERLRPPEQLRLRWHQHLLLLVHPCLLVLRQLQLDLPVQRLDSPLVQLLILPDHLRLMFRLAVHHHKISALQFLLHEQQKIECT